MKKLFLALILFFAIPSQTWAATISRNAIEIDEALSEQEATQYAQPTKILVSQIKTQSHALSTSPREWFKTLYYYTITRLGYADIPYNFVVDRNGNVYEGRKGGVGVLPEVEGGSGVVLVGYLSNSSDITLNANTAFKSLLEDISYKYGIAQENVEVVKLTHLKSGEGRLTAKSRYEKIADLFAESLSTLLPEIEFSSIEHLEYDVEISKVEYPKNVKLGEKLPVTVEFINKNNFAWFTDRDYIYVSTEDGENSVFAVNGVWDSFSKPVSVSDKTVLPGETVKVEFEMHALLLPGNHSQKFNIMKLPDRVFSESDFEVAFAIDKGDLNLVQVVGTPGGVLNARGCPSPNCEPIAQVVEGQVMIMLERSVGWYKVRYEGEKEGWVYGPYIKEL